MWCLCGLFLSGIYEWFDERKQSKSFFNLLRWDGKDCQVWIMICPRLWNLINGEVLECCLIYITGAICLFIYLFICLFIYLFIYYTWCRYMEFGKFAGSCIMVLTLSVYYLPRQLLMPFVGVAGDLLCCFRTKPLRW